MDLKQGDLENMILNALWDLERTVTALHATPTTLSAQAEPLHDDDDMATTKAADKVPAGIDVSQVQEWIKSPTKKWAYTTVKTVMDRLVDKKLAVRVKEGKKYVYRATVQRENAGLDAVQKVLRQYFCNDIDALLTTVQQLAETAVAQPKPAAVGGKSMVLPAATVASRTEVAKPVQRTGAGSFAYAARQGRLPATTGVSVTSALAGKH